jgi:hypothetical protein
VRGQARRARLIDGSGEGQHLKADAYVLGVRVSAALCILEQGEVFLFHVIMMVSLE